MRGRLFTAAAIAIAFAASSGCAGLSDFTQNADRLQAIQASKAESAHCKPLVAPFRISATHCAK